MTPLVLVHGFLGGSAQWQGLKDAFGKEREIIALDLPGFGENAHLSALDRIEDFAGWVINTIQEHGIGSYHLLGHSMGGMIAQEIARNDAERVKKLVLYGTGARGALPGRFETIEESKRRANVDGAAATASRIAATWLKDRETSTYFPMIEKVARRAALPAILAGLDAMKHWDGQDGLKDIRAQSLVIWGDSDRTYPLSQTMILSEGIHGSRLCVLTECAHLAHLEKPEMFQSSLMDFLAGDGT